MLLSKRPALIWWLHLYVKNMSAPCFMAEMQLFFQPVTNSKDRHLTYSLVHSRQFLRHRHPRITPRQPLLHQRRQQWICCLICSIGWICSCTSNVYENNESAFVTCHVIKVVCEKVQGTLQLLLRNKSCPMCMYAGIKGKF